MKEREKERSFTQRGVNDQPMLDKQKGREY